MEKVKWQKRREELMQMSNMLIVILSLRSHIIFYYINNTYIITKTKTETEIKL